MSAYERRVVPLALLAAAASMALAAPPTTSYLTPDRHTVALGDAVALRWMTGPAKTAQPTAWPADRIEWLFIRGGPNQENRETARPAKADEDFVPVEIKHPGVTLIGADERPTVVDMTGAELKTYCAENAPNKDLADKWPAADAKLRVRLVTSTKTLIRVADPNGKTLPSAIATNKTGQAAEMRPQFDPTAAKVGNDVPVTVYIEGAKKDGIKVQATHVASGKTATFVTDPSGSGHFRITDSGAWRVEFHYVAPWTTDDSAAWVIYSATLTFEVAKGAGK